MEKVTLQAYTLERCQQFWQNYEADPDMMDGSFSYDKNWVECYWQSKCHESNRRYFAVCINEIVIGEVQLKSIDPVEKSAVLSIHLNQNSYKNRGFGTEALRQMCDYGFHELKLRKIFADCLHRNHRSRHVLEKLDFQHLGSDDTFHYFVLEK